MYLNQNYRTVDSEVAIKGEGEILSEKEKDHLKMTRQQEDKSESSSMKNQETINEKSGLLKRMFIKLGWRKKSNRTNVDVKKKTCPSKELKNLQLRRGNSNEIASQDLPRVVTVEMIQKAVSIRSGIPISYIQLSDEMKLKRLEERIRKRVVGQNHVIRPIAASIQQSTAGLSDPTKPVGSFLLVGDSGVATDLAKTLVNELFHDEKFLIMMDMINYSDGCSISNFLGAPGYDIQLTEEIRRQPFTILLFERVEKAATAVLNLLVSITSSARLIDVNGRKIDFSNTIVFMTANTDSYDQEWSTEEISSEQVRNNIAQKVRMQFNEELLQHMQILVFDRPSVEHLKKILETKISAICEMLQVRGLQLEVTPCAINSILTHIPKPISVKAIEKWLDDDMKMVLTEKILDVSMPPFSKIIIDVDLEGELKYDVA